ncbi:MAG: hypothetical protein M1480_15370 [Bacteroidetes bacterium]|nr:hypothetical protein [Bacteroidota bacterium]
MKNYIFKIAVLSFFLSTNINALTLINYCNKFKTFASTPIWKVGSQSFEVVETRTGIDAGLFLNWSLTNKIFLLTEIHYIQKGLRFNEPVVSSPQSGNGVDAYVESINPNIKYLSFPVNIKYDLISSEVVPYNRRFDC